MTYLAWQYLVFIFVSCCGVLQAAAAYSGLKGLLFIPRPWPSFGLALALVVGSFVWFFATENRAPPTGWPVLVGGPQTMVFAASAVLAFCFTVLLTSLLPGRGNRQPPPRDDGLEALRETGYPQVLLQRWRRR